jgi:hypothetical protein
MGFLFGQGDRADSGKDRFSNNVKHGFTSHYEYVEYCRVTVVDTIQLDVSFEAMQENFRLEEIFLARVF